MLTIFSLPKSFNGQIAQIQRNAINSWLNVASEFEVMLIGDDDGIAEIANELGVSHISYVKTNSSGTPLLSSAFQIAQNCSNYDLICYINADIILLSDFLSAIEMIKFKRFLMIGRRWNLDVDTVIDFQNAGFERYIRKKLDQFGNLQPPTGSDYFVFCKGTLGDLPNFAVGRPGWDNWMIYNARNKGLPVVDATLGTTVIHQNHDYGHIRRRYDINTYIGPEADRNKELMGNRRTLFDMKDATHVLTKDGLKRRTFEPSYIYRKIRTIPALYPWLRLYVDWVRKITNREM